MMKVKQKEREVTSMKSNGVFSYMCDWLNLKNINLGGVMKKLTISEMKDVNSGYTTNLEGCDDGGNCCITREVFDEKDGKSRGDARICGDYNWYINAEI